MLLGRNIAKIIGKFPIAMTWLLKSLKSFTQLVQAALCGMFLMSTSSLLRHGTSSIVMLQKAVMCVDKMLEF